MRSIWPKLSAALILSLHFALTAPDARAQQPPAPPQLLPKFPLTKSGLELERRTHPGAFLDVLGRKSSLLGYEHKRLEAWAYPLQILDGFEVSHDECEAIIMQARLKAGWVKEEDLAPPAAEEAPAEAEEAPAP